jgi:hypothetical protein
MHGSLPLRLAAVCLSPKNRLWLIMNAFNNCIASHSRISLFLAPPHVPKRNHFFVLPCSSTHGVLACMTCFNSLSFFTFPFFAILASWEKGAVRLVKHFWAIWRLVMTFGNCPCFRVVRTAQAFESSAHPQPNFEAVDICSRLVAFMISGCSSAFHDTDAWPSM